MSARHQGGLSVIEQLSAYVATELETLGDVSALARLLGGAAR